MVLVFQGSHLRSSKLHHSPTSEHSRPYCPPSPRQQRLPTSFVRRAPHAVLQQTLTSLSTARTRPNDDVVGHLPCNATPHFVCFAGISIWAHLGCLLRGFSMSWGTASEESSVKPQVAFVQVLDERVRSQDPLSTFLVFVFHVCDALAWKYGHEVEI